MTWSYVKLDENGKRKGLPTNDFDRKVTGKVIYGVKQYFDENPEEAHRLGWIRCIHHSKKEIREIVGDWNPQTQNLIVTQKQIDEYTVEDTYHVMDKSEEQLLFEEMSSMSDTWGDGVVTFGAVEYDFDEEV